MLKALQDHKKLVNTIAANVRIARIAAHTSQEALGDRLGVTFQQVQKYEKGVNRISAARLVMISEALGVPMSQLYAGCGDGFADGISDEIRGVATIKSNLDMITAFEALPNKHQRAVIDLVKSMADA
jgi:transcriptional regulator with XRE-family HTH domain